MIVIIVFFTLIIALIAFIAIKISVQNFKTKQKNKKIFQKGILRYGTVIGYIDYRDVRYNDELSDNIYMGGNEVSYTNVILSCTDDNNNETEVIIEDW